MLNKLKYCTEVDQRSNNIMMLLHISFYTGVLQFNFNAFLLGPFVVLLMHCRHGPLFILSYKI
jgi:hypothetical protein